jgi:hypothetical protein
LPNQSLIGMIIECSVSNLCQLLVKERIGDISIPIKDFKFDSGWFNKTSLQMPLFAFIRCG